MKLVAPKAPFEWWALYLRALAVLFGLSVLLIGTQTDRATPSLTSLILLLLLFPAGLLSVLEIVKHHQEAYDGSGYPDGLTGDAIPLGSRIIRVADAFDAMTSDRPYRKGRTIAEAMDELRAMGGTMLDPEILDVFLRLLQVKPPFDVQVRLWREQ